MADDEADVNDANNVYGHLRVAQQDPSIFADTFEAYRQQGREEVLREIAKVEEWAHVWDNQGGHAECHFCWNDADTHKPDCLWLRASKVGK